MTPTLLVIVLSIIGIAVFVIGVSMMANRQEGGSGRRPALFMIAGIAVLALGMLSALVLKWSETTPAAEPHFEIPGPAAPAR